MRPPTSILSRNQKGYFERASRDTISPVNGSPSRSGSTKASSSASGASASEVERKRRKNIQQLGICWTHPQKRFEVTYHLLKNLLPNLLWKVEDRSPNLPKYEELSWPYLWKLVLLVDRWAASELGQRNRIGKRDRLGRRGRLVKCNWLGYNRVNPWNASTLPTHTPLLWWLKISGRYLSIEPRYAHAAWREQHELWRMSERT